MPTSIITTEDLEAFKEELLSEIKLLFSQHEKAFGSKKWLKTTEVLELLKISPGTLQNFRTNGTLPFSKIGGIIYYDAQDIQQILTDNKIHHNF